MQNREKRKYVRVIPEESRPIEVQVLGTGFIDILHARNISEGGAKIEVPHLFQGCDIGSPVELIITLPGKRSFRARGQIKHTAGGDNPAFGIRFLELEPTLQNELAVYVRQRVESGAIA